MRKGLFSQNLSKLGPLSWEREGDWASLLSVRPNTPGAEARALVTL